MRKQILFVLVLLVIPMALASPSYWVVVPESGNAMDVVNGANFAASMKGSVAVTFESREYVKAIQEVENIDRDELIAVTFIGDSVEVISGDEPDELVYDNVVVYLQEQGFNVISIDVEDWRMSDDSTIIVTDDEVGEEEELFCATDVKECWDGTFVSRQPALDCEFELCPTQPVENESDSTPNTENSNNKGLETEDDETSPGVFKRVWRWFVGIFN